MSDPIVRELRECCRQVLGERPGCGFFVTPTVLITCAHVLGKVDRGASIPIKRWSGGKVHDCPPATVVEVSIDDDIAVLRTTEQSDCYAPLDRGGRLYDGLVGLGFPKRGDRQEFDQFSAEYEGNTLFLDASGRAGLEEKFKSGQVEPGFSGGPLLNLKTCRVVGLIVASRDRLADLGGWAIDIADVQRLLTHCGITAPPHNPRWRRAQVAQQPPVVRRNRQLLRVVYLSLLVLTISYGIYRELAGQLHYQSLLEPFKDRAENVTSNVFTSEGLFQDQPIYQLLTYNAEKQLARRIEELPSSFYALYGTLENFINQIALRPLALEIKPSNEYASPVTDRFLLYFRQPQPRKAYIEPSGPRVLIRTNKTSYSDDFAELTRCLESAKDRRFQFAPPFASLGFVEPYSACELFLEPERKAATFSELHDLAKRIMKWTNTIFLLPDQKWYVAELKPNVNVNVDSKRNGYIISTMNDYQDRAHYFNQSIYEALSIEGPMECESHRHCVALDDSSIITLGSASLRKSLPQAPDSIVRIDDIKDDHLYLVATVPTHGSLSTLRVFFHFSEIDRSIEKIRMEHPITEDEVETLEKLRDVTTPVGVAQGAMSKAEFFKYIFADVSKSIAVPDVRWRGDILFTICLLLAVAMVDVSLEVSS